ELLAEYEQKIAQAIQSIASASSTAATTPALAAPAAKAPIRPGDFVGTVDGSMLGTVCCIVQDAGMPSGPRYILSAEHVLGITQGMQIARLKGLEVDPKDVVATVERAIALKADASNGPVGTIAKLSVPTGPAQ